jgi:hypothetical protein
MKKIINRKTYNTDTARELGSWMYGYPGYPEYISETLYMTPRGAYFLHGEGGPRSRYARRIAQNSWVGGEDIIPMTADEAREWAEKHLDAKEYEAIFGETAEASADADGGRDRITITLTPEALTILDKLVAERDSNRSREINRLLLAARKE